MPMKNACVRSFGTAKGGYTSSKAVYHAMTCFQMKKFVAVG